MSATTDKLVIPAIENSTFDNQFPDDVDMDYNEWKNLSNCCGSDMTKMVSYNGPDYLDLGICPDCGENCVANKDA